MVKIVDKTALPNQIFKFDSFFLVFFINIVCETKNTNVFEQIFFMRELKLQTSCAEFILQLASLELLEMLWIHV